MDHYKDCQCCGENTIDAEYDICPICGWQDDEVSALHPDEAGIVNKLSLNQAREAHAKTKGKIA